MACSAARAPKSASRSSAAKGNQLPRWLVLLGKAMCFVGLHTFKWIPTPYHVQCRRCGKTSYVGP